MMHNILIEKQFFVTLIQQGDSSNDCNQDNIIYMEFIDIPGKACKPV